MEKKIFPGLEFSNFRRRYVEYMERKDDTYALKQFYSMQAIQLEDDLKPHIEAYGDKEVWDADAIARQLMFDYFGEIFPFVIDLNLKGKHKEFYEVIKPVFLG